MPARLDRLPWSRFHWLVVIALGIAWILDGLEVTIVGSLSGALADSPMLHLSGSQVGMAASAYLIGAVAGALYSYDGIRRFSLPMDDAPAAAPSVPKARRKTAVLAGV